MKGIECMKVSVCVCAYNAEQTIARTIESVLKQTYSNFEIIVINDGSSDATQQIVERYQQEASGKITLKSIPNGGLANARNEALALCTGDLYINLDADDYLEPDTFEKAVAVIEGHPRVDVCFYGYKEFDENGVFFASYSDAMHYLARPVTGVEAFSLRLKRYLWICQGNALYRMSLIRENEITNHPGKNQGEDMYFICRCLLAAREVFCFQGDNFCCMSRSESMNHEKFNPSFFSCIQLLAQLEQDVHHAYPERLDEILPMIRSERVVQSLAITKRMARALSRCDFAKEAKVLKDILSPYDAGVARNLPDKQKKIEYRICSASFTAYYYVTRLYDRIY